MKNCMDCQNHKVIPDPDPDDWFCDDDEAVVCTDVSNPAMNMASRHKADHSAFRAVTVACRPYNKRKEAERPEWCPLTANAKVSGGGAFPPSA